MSAGRWDTALYGAALLEIDAARRASGSRDQFIKRLRDMLARERWLHAHYTEKAAQLRQQAREEERRAPEYLRRASECVAAAAQAEQLAYAVADALAAEGAEDVVRDVLAGGAT